MVRQMIMEYGMSDELGPLTYGRRQEAVFLGRDLMRARDYSDEVASKIDRAIRHIVMEQYDRAKSLLLQHRQTLNRLALALIEKETLESDELRAIVYGSSIHA
jgi:cell division protease FtsH